MRCASTLMIHFVGTSLLMPTKWIIVDSCAARFRGRPPLALFVLEDCAFAELVVLPALRAHSRTTMEQSKASMSNPGTPS